MGQRIKRMKAGCDSPIKGRGEEAERLLHVLRGRRCYWTGNRASVFCFLFSVFCFFCFRISFSCLLILGFCCLGRTDVSVRVGSLSAPDRGPVASRLWSACVGN